MGGNRTLNKGHPSKKRRLKEVGQEFDASRDLSVEESLDAARPDADLFFVDTDAHTHTHKHKSSTWSKAEKRRKFFEEKEKEKARGGSVGVSLPSIHLVKAVQKLVEREKGEGKTGGSGKGKATTTKKETEDVYDMWGDAPEEDAGAKKGGKKSKKKGTAATTTTTTHTVSKRQTRPLKPPAALVVPLIAHPLPGQSYHPDADAHQEALQQALVVEEKREAFLAQLKAPLSTMSEETKALLLSDSDSEDDEDKNKHTHTHDDDDNEEDKTTSSFLTSRRVQGKLTKAQRNKQRRVKAAAHEAILAKEAKALTNSTARARELAKKLNKQEAHTHTKSSKKTKNNKSKHPQPHTFTPKDLPSTSITLPQDKNPLRARSLPVPLSDELGGSLRLLKQKGNLASETLEGLQRRGQYEPVPHRKSARAKERVRYVEKFRGE